MNQLLLANRYQIIKKIGEGGMGIVWHVYDSVNQREVALKQIHKKKKPFKSLPDDKVNTEKLLSISFQEKSISNFDLTTLTAGSVEGSLRFKQEFRTMVKLKHPNTVEVYDYGVLKNGDDYITMEIVSGEPLSDIIKKRELTFREIYHILTQIAQILSFIHARVMVHRDIKTSNICLTDEGDVKLMDFGLMMSLGLPSNGEITGTVNYLPPEVPQGGIIDGRSDLYSLGILAYELVTGKLPFTGKNIPEVIKKHMESAVPQSSRLRNNIPQELEQIILKLLSKNPSDRYQTPGTLISDLIALSGETITEQPLEHKKSYLNCSELIGREKELEQFKDSFHLMREAQGQSILVAAPAGVGKSRMIQEFKLKVQLAEIPFVDGKCFEQGMMPYQPIADAFRPLLPYVKKDLMDQYGGVLVKVMPELRKKGYKPLANLDEVAERVRIFEQVSQWLIEVTKITPIVICIEDLHWADNATLELFNACIRETKDQRCMILGSYRDDELDHSSILFQTVDEGLAQVMTLTNFEQDDLESLIKGMLGEVDFSEGFTEQINTVTDGNAFFVSEVMRTLIEDNLLTMEQGRWILPMDVDKLILPDSIESTVTRRLKHLSADALDVARIAAVVGRSLDLSMLKFLSDYEDDHLFEIIEELIEHQFIKFEDNYYQLTHDRVRETLYNQIKSPKREFLHEKCGVILEERHKEYPEVIINELAYHFNKSANKSKAVDYQLLAGEQAMQINAFVEAIKLFRKAEVNLQNIDYPDKKWILLEIWDKLCLAGLDYEAKISIECGEKLIEELSKMGNVNGFMRLTINLFKAIDYLPFGINEKLKDLLVQDDPPPISKLRPRNRIEEFLNNLFPKYSVIIPNVIFSKCYIAAAATLTGNFEKSLHLQKDVMYSLPDKKSVGYAAVLMSHAVTLEFLGHHKEICIRLKQAIEIFERKKIAESSNRRLKWLYTSCFWLHELMVVWRGYPLTDQGQMLKKGLDFAEKNQFMDSIFWHHYVKNHYWIIRGDTIEVEKMTNVLFPILKKMGKPTDPEGALCIDLGQAALERGDWDNAKKYSQRGYELGKMKGHELQIEFGRVLLGLIAYNGKDNNTAKKYLLDTVNDCRANNVERLMPALSSLAEIYLNQNDLKRAEKLICQALDLAKQDVLENPYYQTSIYRIKALIALKQKEYTQAEDDFYKSLSIAHKYDISIQKGLTLLSLAQMQIELTQFTVANKTLEDANEIFQNIGNDYLKNRTREIRKTLAANA